MEGVTVGCGNFEKIEAFIVIENKEIKCWYKIGRNVFDRLKNLQNNWLRLKCWN
jgi:hypothetical protein